MAREGWKAVKGGLCESGVGFLIYLLQKFLVLLIKVSDICSELCSLLEIMGESLKRYTPL